MTISEYIAYLEKIDVEESAQKAVSANENDLILQLQAQMRKGELSDGSSFRGHSISIPESYEGAEYDDLFETGDFQKSLFIDDEFEFWGGDWKTEYIFNDLGYKVFMINTNDIHYQAEVQPKIRDKFIELIKK